MLLWRLVACLFSIFAPGAGHALVGKFWRGACWCLLFLAVSAGTVFWPQLVLATFAVRLGAVIDVLVASRRATAPGAGDWIGAGVMLGTMVAAIFSMHSAVEMFRVPSGGMAPTIEIGDHVVVRKLGYTPARGDVIVFRQPAQGPLPPPAAGRLMVKRIVALGGQTVAVRGQVVHIDGAAMPLRAIGAARYLNYDDQTGVWAADESFELEETIGDRSYRLFGVPLEAGADRSDFPTSEGCARAGMEAAAGSDPPACTVPRGSIFVLGDNRDNSSDSRVYGAIDQKLIVGRVVGTWWAQNPDGIGWDRIGRIR